MTDASLAVRLSVLSDEDGRGILQITGYSMPWAGSSTETKACLVWQPRGKTADKGFFEKAWLAEAGSSVGIFLNLLLWDRPQC